MDNGRFKKGQIPWMKGKKHSEESKRKMSKSHLGKKYSEKICKEISMAHKGKSLWNEGMLKRYFCIKCSSEITYNTWHYGTKRCGSCWQIGKMPPHTAFKKGHLTWNKGKKSSDESRKKMSKAHIGQIPKHLDAMHERNKGEGYYNWQGGKTSEPYGVEFDNILREKIRKRDNHVCQECGYPESKLNYKLPT